MQIHFMMTGWEVENKLVLPRFYSATKLMRDKKRCCQTKVGGYSPLMNVRLIFFRGTRDVWLVAS